MTRTTALVMLFVSLAGATASQLILKSRLVMLSETLQLGHGVLAVLMRALSDPYIWLGGGCVIIGGCCWYLALTKLPLSFMLPAASIIAPCASIGAYYFFGESLTVSKICAIAFIMIGVSWLGWLNA
jgi:drug/metabolite transporter (DMT)-like permease